MVDPSSKGPLSTLNRFLKYTGFIYKYTFSDVRPSHNDVVLNCSGTDDLSMDVIKRGRPNQEGTENWESLILIVYIFESFGEEFDEKQRGLWRLLGQSETIKVSDSGVQTKMYFLYVRTGFSTFWNSCRFSVPETISDPKRLYLLKSFFPLLVTLLFVY